MMSVSSQHLAFSWDNISAVFKDLITIFCVFWCILCLSFVDTDELDL